MQEKTGLRRENGVTRTDDEMSNPGAITTEGKSMNTRSAISALALAATMVVGLNGAQAHDPKKYPGFGGQWKRPPGIANQYDTSRPQRLGQVPPLTKEYQLKWEAGLQDQN